MRSRDDLYVDRSTLVRFIPDIHLYKVAGHPRTSKSKPIGHILRTLIIQRLKAAHNKRSSHKTIRRPLLSISKRPIRTSR